MKYRFLVVLFVQSELASECGCHDIHDRYFLDRLSAEAYCDEICSLRDEGLLDTSVIHCDLYMCGLRYIPVKHYF